MGKNGVDAVVLVIVVCMCIVGTLTAWAILEYTNEGEDPKYAVNSEFVYDGKNMPCSGTVEYINHPESSRESTLQFIFSIDYSINGEDFLKYSDEITVFIDNKTNQPSEGMYVLENTESVDDKSITEWTPVNKDNFRIFVSGGTVQKITAEKEGCVFCITLT